MLNLTAHPHRRFNPLTGEWVLVSPHRTQRPWQGQVESLPPQTLPRYDPQCYLCPGNARAGGNPVPRAESASAPRSGAAQGKRNPPYDTTFVFQNDFAALLPDTPTGAFNRNDLLRAESERGVCRVVCFSPRHDLTLPDMPLPDIRRVVDVWAEQTAELGALDFVNYVQVFENKGAQMGASNPHPHCQIWASERVPSEPAKELRALSAYHAARGACLLCDYLALELQAGERIVVQNDHFVALVPFWAVWPFETMVVARRHIGSLPDLNDAERTALADVMRRLTTRYDNLFEVSFPYSMGFHQSPCHGTAQSEAHLHAHYYPPLLRSATVRKFMVGFEMLGNPQRDLTAETAAARLRELSDTLQRT